MTISKYVKIPSEKHMKKNLLSDETLTNTKIIDAKKAFLLIFSEYF